MRTLTTTLAFMLAAVCISGSEAGEPVETMARVAHNMVVDGNNRFSLALYQKLRTTDGNLFFSPYSISTALAMTYAGAEGPTEEQMADVLCFPTSARTLERMAVTGTPITREEFAEMFGGIIKDLKVCAENGKFQLTVANALWGQKDYAFLPSFTQLVESEYGGRLQEVDFRQAAEQARQTINTWVEKQTSGKITDLIGPGVLHTMTRLVLTNAIYFKGNWASQFKANHTRLEPFTLLGGESVQTPMMNQKETFGYAGVGANDDSPLQILELPYVGDELSMVILLPKTADDIERMQRDLTAENLTTWLDQLRRREVKVTIPKFKMTSRFSLARVLTSMGMGQAFSSGADFSGMTGRRELYLSAVVHQAYVEVNEEGTEAAAATGAAMRLTSMGPDRTPIFRADHPFVFMIRANRSGSILFLGRVMNPGREK